jgi:hypothetical protein
MLRERLRLWLGISGEAATLDEESVDDNDADNAKAIAEPAYRRYTEEHARGKDIEAKAGPILSLLSAEIIFGAGNISNGGRCLGGWEAWIFYVILIVGIIMLVLAELNMLLVLSIQVFKYINLREWALEKYTRRSSTALRSTYEDIAGSYRSYTDENIALNNKKTERYTRALGFLFFGVVIIVSDFMWAGCGLPRLW